MTKAAAASDKPFDMLSALAEGFRCHIDTTKKRVTALTADLHVPTPLTIQNVALTALSSHTGSTWVMPQVGGIPFTCSPSVREGGIIENPPILRLRDATMELVADPQKTKIKHTYQIRIIHGRTLVLEALRDMLLVDLIKTIILPYYSKEPAESPSDHYYFRDNRYNPCFTLSYLPWWNLPSLPNPPIAQSVQRIKEAMIKKGATACNTSSHFKDAKMPWIQHEVECDRLVAHVMINSSEFLLVNHFDLDSVQQYTAITTAQAEREGRPTASLQVNATGACEPIRIGYVQINPTKNTVTATYPSVVGEYEKAVVPAAPTAAATATTMTVGTLNNKEN